MWRRLGKGKAKRERGCLDRKHACQWAIMTAAASAREQVEKNRNATTFFSHYLNGDLSLHHGLAWGATVAPSSNSSSNPQFRFLSSLAAAKVAGQDRTKYAYLRFFPVTEATSCIVLRLHIERNTNQNMFGASRCCLRQRFVWPYSSCGQAKKNRCNKWELIGLCYLGCFCYYIFVLRNMQNLDSLSFINHSLALF